jgi:hypothetical protein
MSEKDNNGNYQKIDHYQQTKLDNGVKTNDKAHHDNNNNNNNVGSSTTILPRAKILSTSILDASGVDYNLRTQTIERFNPQQKHSLSEKEKMLAAKTLQLPFVPHRSDTKKQQIEYNSYTLPSTRRESQKHNHRIQTQYTPNFITLDNALNFDFFHRLTPTQGWAILCQSIQALQDLFLSGMCHNLL